MSNINVLIVTEYFYPAIKGGGEISSLLLAKSLIKKGINVSVLTSYFDGLNEFEVIDGIKIYRWINTGSSVDNLFSNLKRFTLFNNSVKKEVLKFLKENNVDIIHAMNITSMPGVALIKNKGLKKIAHINSPLAFCPKGTKIRFGVECKIKCSFFKYFLPCFVTSSELGRMSNKFYLKYNIFVWLMTYLRWRKIRNSIKKFDFYFPISNYMKSWLNKYDIENSNISIIPNIIELDSFLKLKKSENKIPKILYVGGYTYSKGVFVLANALKNIKIPFKMSFYGSGDLKKDLINFVKQNKINATINDEVNYSKIPEIYQSHDIIIFPSLVPEAFGRIAIEAMAAGKPVIATKIGGIKELINDKINGFLFNSGDHVELQKIIESLIKNKRLRDIIGQNGRKESLKYDKELIVNEVIEKYNQLIKK